MQDRCFHDYEVQFHALLGVRFVCKRCGTRTGLRRKYACRLYLIGLIGGIPSLLFYAFGAAPVLYHLLSPLIYLAVNAIVDYLFYRWLSTREPIRINRFIDD